MSTRRKKIDKAALARKAAVTEELYIPADEDQAERYEEARQKRSLAMFAGDEAELEKANAALEAVKDEIAEQGIVMTFKAIGRKRFDEILIEHPPTDAQKKEDEDAGKPDAERYTFNPETFWPALFAETVLSDLTADEWRENVLDSADWNGAEVSALKDAAKRVNMTSRVADLGN